MGLLALVAGMIPLAIGLYGVTISGMQLTQDAMEKLKDQLGGQTILNCALASVALANQGADAYMALLRVSRTQSAVLIVGGALATLSYVFLLRFLTQLRAKVGE